MAKSYPFPKVGWRGTNISVSSLINTGSGTLGKVVVNSHTSGTFKLFNGTSYGANAMGGTYTPATGSSINLFELDFDNLFIAVGGTADLTVLYDDK